MRCVGSSDRWMTMTNLMISNSMPSLSLPLLMRLGVGAGADTRKRMTSLRATLWDAIHAQVAV